MSRRSKRRRGMQGQPAPDGFEFTDDRSQRATVAPLPASPLPGHDAPSGSDLDADAEKPAKAPAAKPAKPAKSDRAAEESSAVATAVASADAADATRDATHGA